MPTPDKQLSAEQSRQVAATIREEIARRRISRQHLAEQAKLSISTLEKALGGRRPFTLATTVRLEQALGVSLRKGPDAPLAVAPTNGDVAPDGLGAYSRRSVSWLEGDLPDAAALVRRQERDLRLSHRDHLGCSGVVPGVPRRRKAWMRRTRNSARSRCRTSPAMSISSPTGTASIA